MNLTKKLQNLHNENAEEKADKLLKDLQDKGLLSARMGLLDLIRAEFIENNFKKIIFKDKIFDEIGKHYTLFLEELNGSERYKIKPKSIYLGQSKTIHANIDLNAWYEKSLYTELEFIDFGSVKEIVGYLMIPYKKPNKIRLEIKNSVKVKELFLNELKVAENFLLTNKTDLDELYNKVSQRKD